MLGLPPAEGRSSRLHSPAQPRLLRRRCSLSPPTTMPPSPSPAPPTPIPLPPEAPPQAPLYRPPALPVAASPPSPPSPLAICLQVHAPIRCLRQAQCLPLPHAYLPRLPAPSRPLHAFPHPRRRPTAPIPPDGATRPAPALPDAQPHRAQPHLTRSLTAQPHPTPYRARTRHGSECQGQSAPLPPPSPSPERH